MSKGAQIACGATAIALLLGWYGWAQLGGEASFTYYQSIEEFRESEVARTGRPARVHGYVVLGSIDRDVASRQVRFAVQSEPPHAQSQDPSHPEGREQAPFLSVVFASLETPDLFKDGAEVVVEGRALAVGPPGQLRFDADKVMAKCPSKFEGMDPTQTASLD